MSSEAYQRKRARDIVARALTGEGKLRGVSQTLNTSKIQYGVLRRLKQGGDPVPNLYKKHPKTADRILETMLRRELIEMPRAGAKGYTITEKGVKAIERAVAMRRAYGRF